MRTGRRRDRDIVGLHPVWRAVDNSNLSFWNGVPAIQQLVVLGGLWRTVALRVRSSDGPDELALLPGLQPHPRCLPERGGCADSTPFTVGPTRSILCRAQPLCGSGALEPGPTNHPRECDRLDLVQPRGVRLFQRAYPAIVCVDSVLVCQRRGAKQLDQHWDCSGRPRSPRMLWAGRWARTVRCATQQRASAALHRVVHHLRLSRLFRHPERVCGHRGFLFSLFGRRGCERVWCDCAERHLDHGVLLVNRRALCHWIRCAGAWGFNLFRPRPRHRVVRRDCAGGGPNGHSMLPTR
mmetsp:Transcript_18367/g.47979  ORF Transcript_18367/g.47979 Transcript_18367/m.47979 type:complete len:295 (+) Transcript_18367:200-1084(+)